VSEGPGPTASADGAAGAGPAPARRPRRTLWAFMLLFWAIVPLAAIRLLLPDPARVREQRAVAARAAQRSLPEEHWSRWGADQAELAAYDVSDVQGEVRRRIAVFDRDGAAAMRLRWVEPAAGAGDDLVLVTARVPERGLDPGSLHLWARGFLAPKLLEGEQREVPFATSGEGPGAGGAQATATVALARGRQIRRLRVPAGEFAISTFTCVRNASERWAYEVEVAWPHRVIAWSGPGESAMLTGSERLRALEIDADGGCAAVRRLAASGLAR
jgi:hypothetical protein